MQKRATGARPPTPLRRYLDDHPNVTARAIGKTMADLLGREPTSASLSQWTTGVMAPSPIAQLAMEQATLGEVTPLDWTRWRAGLEDDRPHEARSDHPTSGVHAALMGRAVRAHHARKNAPARKAPAAARRGLVVG